MNINIRGIVKGRIVFVNGKELDPKYSQSIINHSPDGFNWGYGGSGPAQLALAILLQCTDIRTAIRNYQKFKEDYIASRDISGKDFDITINIQKYIGE